MNPLEQKKALASAVQAARAAGKLMRENLHAAKTVNAATAHDIKLELDVRCQRLIERKLRAAFPRIALLGEEGDSGARDAEYRWVVDPIDGTVNYAYGIPHACVSIALQESVRCQVPGVRTGSRIVYHAPRITQYVTLLGVVYDPFQDELWTAIRGQRAYLNGKVIRASTRRKLSETVVSIGFGKSRSDMERALRYFIWLVRRVRKIRMLGSAALGLTYVATGRIDGYIERDINLWDIAAGGLILECAGGNFWIEPVAGRERYRLVASNGLLHRHLPVPK